MNTTLITVVVVGSALAYASIALITRARAARERGPSIRRIGGLPAVLPYFVWVPYAIVALRVGPELAVPELARWVGLAVVVAGIAFAVWAALTLGRHFDMEVEVHRGHEVVTSGPYAIVRHPVYSGLGLHFVGACLATGNWVLILGTLFVTFPALWYRAGAEERLLRSELPGYDAYARRVGQLVPGIR